MSAHHTRFLDPKNDYAFKRVFGHEQNKDVLIAFLNDILDHKYIGQIAMVDLLPDINNPRMPESTLDILCRDQQGVQYIVKMQLTHTNHLLKRAHYYTAQAYGLQIATGGKYKSLKAVIFLAIADVELYPEKKQVKSDHFMLGSGTKKRDLNNLCFTFIELPKFQKSVDELESNAECWYYYLKHASETVEPAYEKLVSNFPIMKRAFHELDKAYWNETEIHTYEQMLKKSRDEASRL
ncbi:MAG: Rpn family recombination-promoting nuclease/putative transposase [Bacteroidota bacterium]